MGLVYPQTSNASGPELKNSEIKNKKPNGAKMMLSKNRLENNFLARSCIISCIASYILHVLHYKKKFFFQEIKNIALILQENL